MNNKKWKKTNKKLELVIGDLDCFESPAIRIHGTARDNNSAQRVLVLAANDLNLDPIGYTWLDK